jgi:hypothetical protein
MLRTLIASCVLGSVLIISSLAMAQEGPQGQGGAPDVIYKKKTVYDFEDDMVEGELQRPDGELVETQRKAKHSSLIKIRTDFIPEMLKSADDI